MPRKEEEMQKKYFTVEDLIRFCEQKKMYNFSSKESGKPIVIQAIQDFSSADVEETADNKLYAKVRVCHTLLNRNGSYISEDSMKAAMPSLKYSPLLANIHQLDDGTWDFHSHDYHIEKDEDGNENVIYDEKQVGTFTADEPYLEYDKDMDKTYVVARVVIPESYTRCADIIREKNGTKVSCELIIYECSYNAKEKYLQLDNFEFAGCTCLGSEKDGTPIGEGMLGSKITLEDFSEENNSLIKFNEKMVELQARLEKLETACFDNKKNNSKEGGNKNLNKFEELCQKYEKTVNDITFDYENMSDDELVEAFAKAFDETDSTNDGSEGADTPSGSETTTDGNEEGENNPTEKNPDESEKGDTTEDETPFIDDDESKKKVNNSENTVEYSFTKNGEIKKFAVSLQDKIYAIQDLVNATYAETDNTYYGVTVYDDYVIMCDWWSGRYYKQTYDSKDDNYSLTGDRVEVYVEFVTADEQKEIESMRSNYAELKAFKENVEKNELHSKKESLLADEKYSVLSDNEEFTELKKNMDNYSLDDLETKAKVIFADYVSSVGNFSLNSSNENKSHSMQLFGDPNTRRNSRSGRYGDIFKK
jgi:hypothetical protein